MPQDVVIKRATRLTCLASILGWGRQRKPKVASCNLEFTYVAPLVELFLGFLLYAVGICGRCVSWTLCGGGVLNAYTGLGRAD